MRSDRITREVDATQSHRRARVNATGSHHVPATAPAPCNPLHRQHSQGDLSMRIFVTGASGWIGSAVVPELISSGHQVLGLARSDASAKAVAGMGAEVLRG